MSRNGIIQITSPQSILLLGDVAAQLGREALSVAAKPCLTVKIRKLPGKTSFFHFNKENIHIELSQQTPIIPKGAGNTVRRIIILTHALVIHSSFVSGFDIEVEPFAPINTTGIVETLLVCLVKGIAQLDKRKLSEGELLDSCIELASQTNSPLSLYLLGGSMYGGFVYTNPTHQQVEGIGSPITNLYTLPLRKPTPGRLKKDIIRFITAHTEKYKKNLEQLGKLSTLGKIALEKGDLAKFGEYINRTQNLLIAFGLVSEEAHKQCIHAMLSGALGAKYSVELDSVLIVCDERGVEVKAELIKRGLKVEEFPLA